MELKAAARQHIEDVLGVPVTEPVSWAQSSALPYFLLDGFEFVAVTIGERSLVWAVSRNDSSKLTPAEVRQRLEKVEALTGQRVVYVVGAMASHERRRLIQSRVSFLVPGNQLYLPELAIDLREHFKQRSAEAPSALGPSTQALLIEALLRAAWTPEWRPAAGGLNAEYSAMTRSRALRELSAAGLGNLFKEGRSQALRFIGTAAQVWEKAKPLMRSPVSRETWVLPGGAAEMSLPLAGISALAANTMLVEPTLPTYALSNAQWKSAFERGATVLEEPQEGASLWQLWTYRPDIGPNAKSVDPMSLTLSLQHDSDDRVQIALDELKERFPW